MCCSTRAGVVLCMLRTTGVHVKSDCVAERGWHCQKAVNQEGTHLRRGSLHSHLPPTADPASGADTATLDATLRAPLPSGFVPVRLTAAGYGEVRLRVGFSDGSEALAHYYVLPPFERQVAALGAHLREHR